jgi:hypothetical protein
VRVKRTIRSFSHRIIADSSSTPGESKDDTPELLPSQILKRDEEGRLRECLRIKDLGPKDNGQAKVKVGTKEIAEADDAGPPGKVDAPKTYMPTVHDCGGVSILLFE